MGLYLLVHTFNFISDISVTAAAILVVFHFDDPEQSLSLYLATKNTSFSTRCSADLINTQVTPRAFFVFCIFPF